MPMPIYSKFTFQLCPSIKLKLDLVCFCALMQSLILVTSFPFLVFSLLKWGASTLNRTTMSYNTTVDTTNHCRGQFFLRFVFCDWIEGLLLSLLLIQSCALLALHQEQLCSLYPFCCYPISSHKNTGLFTSRCFRICESLVCGFFVIGPLILGNFKQLNDGQLVTPTKTSSHSAFTGFGYKLLDYLSLSSLSLKLKMLRDWNSIAIRCSLAENSGVSTKNDAEYHLVDL